jgi:imidazolonepropionase
MSALLFRNARLVTMAPPSAASVVPDGVVLAEDGWIRFAGRTSALDPTCIPADAEVFDCEGRLVTPGLIDCHTHLVHAGHRAREFEMRLAGASYEEIARAGGGIVSTVRATREASESELVAAALPRLDQLIGEGVTTVEVKSGYGLGTEAELRQLRAALRLSDERPVTVRTSFLGAHAVPPEYRDDRAGYLELLLSDMLPKVAAAGLADAVDAFAEEIAFSASEVARLFDAAHALGLPVRLHADQLANGHGAALAARYGALSADHLEYTDAAGAAALARAGTVAVLLPGAFYFIRESRLPPVDLFRANGVRMAVATDCNPGTAPLSSLITAVNMAATLFRLTVPECLAGVTVNAAAALGLSAETGSLVAGKWCDLAVWDVGTPAELVYRIAFNPLHARVQRGRLAKRS